MRLRALVVAALSCPVVLAAQVTRPPRTGQAPPPTSPRPGLPAPEPTVVGRALQYQRSRWSGEGYSLISTTAVPISVGGSARYTTVGTGTRGLYRFSDNWSATMDMTAAFLGSPAFTETAEVGTRYAPASFESELRPFVDVRAAYLRMNDQYLAPAGASFDGLASTIDRYTRGFGAVTGAGFDVAVSRSVALTNEVSVLRSRMSTYRLGGAFTGLPTVNNYWMTSFRYAIGFKFTPVRTLHLDQNPMK
jgi:hypothetical protein